MARINMVWYRNSLKGIGRFFCMNMPAAVAVLAVLVISGTGAQAFSIPDLVVYSEEDRPQYVLLVEKATQQLFLFSFYKNSIRKEKQWKCSTGENHGPKLVMGDKKTPEGIYFFTRKYVDSELAPIYGTLAFPLDYPNVLDHEAGKNGSAIWLHGANKVLKNNDSNGCVALENENIDALAPYIELYHTPIVIVHEVAEAPWQAVPRVGKAVGDLVRQWNDALVSGAYHDYLRFYDPRYLPDMGWWKKWRQVRGEVAGELPDLYIDMDSLLVVRYEKNYVALFDMVVSAGGSWVKAGRRKLFLEETADGLKIIGDTFQSPEVKGGAQSPSNRLVAACRDVYDVAVTEKSVRRMLDQWLSAWSRMDMDAYGTFYAEYFVFDGMNKNRWLAHKRKLNRQYDYIRVAMDNLRFVETSPAACVVTFIQKYESDRYSDMGLKTLVLKKEDGQWRIHRESWETLNLPPTPETAG